jgi:hypothetical protein
VDVKEPKQSVAGLFGRAAASYDQVGFFTRSHNGCEMIWRHGDLIG